MVLRRIRFLVAVTALLFGVLWIRLAHLQAMEHDFWEREALASRTGGRPVPFARGDILDRFGRPLAEGEIVHRLDFVFHTFRRETPLGLLYGALRLLADREPELSDHRWTLAAVASRSEEAAERLLEWRLSSIRSWDGRARGDLFFYARRLLGLEEREARRRWEKALERDGRIGDLVPNARARIVAAAARQREALADLEEALGWSPGSLLERIDQEVARLEARVAAETASLGDLSVKRRRSVRRDLERRPRTLEPRAPFRVVYLIHLVPERYAGFRIEDVERRLYPDETRDVAPLLVGRVGAPSPEAIERRERDRREYLRLISLPSERKDASIAERIALLRDRLRFEHVLPDEEVGISGLERTLEPVLRGRRGWRLEERTGDRRLERVLELVAPLDGLDVRLSLDADLQRAAQEVLDAHAEKGALVVLDPRDGEVLALATTPRPTRDDLRRRYAELVADPAGPLYHRAYRPPGNPPPPGSVFKLVTAAAALEAGALDPAELLRCDGTLHVGGTVLQCYHRLPHGSIDVVEALARSCNVFFYEVARRVRLAPLVAAARAAGFGEPTGIADPQRLGLEPGTPGLGEAGCPLQPGRGLLFAMRTAIGHAAVDDCTPLQVARMVSAVANGGFVVAPRLVLEIGGVPVPRAAPRPVGWSKRTLDVLREGMIAAVEYGTARPTNGDDLRRYRVAAKTGTPQAIERGRYVEHAWMAGFLPYDRPVLAFAVFVEDSPVGGGRATRPIVAALLRRPEAQRAIERGLAR